MRTAKRAATISSGEVEAAQQMVEVSQQLVAQRAIELENLEAEVETLPAGPQRQAAQAQRDAAKRELAKARGEFERWEAALNGLKRRVEEEKKAASAQQRVVYERELEQRRRAWIERLRQAGAHYEALLSLVESLLPPAGFPVPSPVKQSLTALTWDVARWLKGASE